jgi:RNA-directed DNA polymerase
MPIAMSGVKSYYSSLDHHILYDILHDYIADRRVLRLLWDYMHRTVRDDGTYQEVQRGISLGCPLSPLMGALYLKRLDDRMAETGLFYARFMDDWVVLAPTRWKLRRAIKAANLPPFFHHDLIAPTVPYAFCTLLGHGREYPFGV